VQTMKVIVEINENCNNNDSNKQSLRVQQSTKIDMSYDMT